MSHLQFEALLTAARESPNVFDFALVAMLGLLGLRIFEAGGADIADVGEEHGHRVLRVHGKGSKIVLVPLPPAVGRAIDRAIADRTSGPILLNRRGAVRLRLGRAPDVTQRAVMPLTVCLAVLVVWLGDAGNVGLAAGVSLVGDERRTGHLRLRQPGQWWWG